MTAFLFDVNVLLALFDSDHEHHRAASRWWSTCQDDEWCTCPITELGFLRIASGSKYPRIKEQLPELIVLFRELCQAPDHRYWPDDIFLSNLLLPNHAELTSGKSTDIYLLALAVAHGGKLATFDGNIPARLVPDGLEALEIIAS